MPAHKSTRTPEEKRASRRAASLRFARKPEAKIRAQQRYEKSKDTPEFRSKVRAQRLRRSFGISLEEFERLIASQNERCGLCQEPLGSWEAVGWAPLQPVVDHNHDTGAIRGILHRKCNSAIGFLGDSVDLARLAVAYLEKT